MAQANPRRRNAPAVTDRAPADAAGAPSWPAELAVRDAAAAELLTDVRATRFLKPFMGRACGLSEAARELGVGRSLMSYWTGRLQGAGLLVAVPAEVARRSAWRASADSFVVALQDLPQDSDAAVLDRYMAPGFEQLKQALLRVARRDVDQWQYRLRALPQGTQQLLEPRSGDLWDTRLLNDRANLHLSERQAAELRAELAALLRRYVALSQRGRSRKRYLAWVCAVEDLPG
jgi:hypothetical protein